MAILDPNTLCQIAFVVHDLDAAIRRFQDTLGLGEPWFIQTEGHAVSRTLFEGRPTDGTARLAFFSAGQIEIELIEPDDKPSVWRDHLDRLGEGVHHIAFQTPDMLATEAALKPMGIGLKQYGYGTDGGGYGYLDSAEKLGVMIELLE